MRDPEAIIVWDGTHAYNGGYLGCMPEAPHGPIIVGPECAMERQPRPARRGPPVKSFAGLVEGLERILTAEPQTIVALSVLGHWTRNTTMNAIYWHRKSYPGVLKTVPVPRTSGIGRRPLGYFLP